MATLKGKSFVFEAVFVQLEVYFEYLVGISEKIVI